MFKCQYCLKKLPGLKEDLCQSCEITQVCKKCKSDRMDFCDECGKDLCDKCLDLDHYELCNGCYDRIIIKKEYADKYEKQKWGSDDEEEEEKSSGIKETKCRSCNEAYYCHGDCGGIIRCGLEKEMELNERLFEKGVVQCSECCEYKMIDCTRRELDRYYCMSCEKKMD